MDWKMGNSFSKKLKDKKIAYGALLMSVGILLHYAIEQYSLLDEELFGFFTGLFFGAGVLISLSVLINKKNT